MMISPLTRILGHTGLLYIVAFLIVLGSPTTCTKVTESKRCPAIEQRKEWRDMSFYHRVTWTSAVRCLHSKRATNNLGGATTRYEQFSAVHAQLFAGVHFVGQFLPWHRHIVTLFHKALREECWYDGPVPYWDWTRDSDKPDLISISPVFDPVTGLGGDGVPGTYTPPSTEGLHYPWTAHGCIGTGPFKTMLLRIGPGTAQHGVPHCIARGFNETWRPFMVRSAVDEALYGARSFAEFIEIIDRDFVGIHAGAHFYVGGDMGDGSSPNDPLFYLHHAQMDRLWWLWQRGDPSKRVYDIAGPTTQNGTIPATLDDVMEFPGLGGEITVREVMDTLTSPSCYTY